MNRKRVIISIVVLIIAVATLSMLGLFSLGVYLKRRSGADFERELAALLPPDTPFYFSFRRPAEFLDRLEDGPLWREWEESGALRALLDRKKRLAKLQRNVEKVERFTPYKIKDRIIKRWLADHFVIALVPPPREGLAPGILLLAQTRVGFEEDLAEFIAENFPEIEVFETGEGEQRITLYRGKKDKRSLTFMRFGRTIVLSLRSPETAYLLDVEARRNNPSAPTLADVESFGRWRETQGGDIPLAVYCHPAETARMFLDHPHLRPENANQIESIEWFFDKTQKGALATGAIGFDDIERSSLNVTIELEMPRQIFDLEQLEAAAPRFRTLDFATSQTLAAFAMKGDDMHRLFGWQQRSLPLAKKGSRYQEQLTAAFATIITPDLMNALNPNLGRENGILLNGIMPALLIPQLDCLAYVGMTDTAPLAVVFEKDANDQKSYVSFPDDAATLKNVQCFELSNVAIPVFAIKRKIATLIESDPSLMLIADDDPYEAMRVGIDSAAPPPDINIRPANEAHALVYIFLHTRRLSAILDTVYAGIPIFAEELREDIERFMVYAAMLAPLDRLFLELTATENGLQLNLRSQ